MNGIRMLRGAPLALLVLASAPGCAPEDDFIQPAGFQGQVLPLLQRHCGECHTAAGTGTRESGFAVDSYENVMKGTRYGPVVVPGSAVSSSLYRLVAGEVDPSIRMPHGKAQLAESEIRLIARWIDQGAKDD